MLICPLVFQLSSTFLTDRISSFIFFCFLFFLCNFSFQFGFVSEMMFRSRAFGLDLRGAGHNALLCRIYHQLLMIIRVSRSKIFRDRFSCHCVNKPSSNRKLIFCVQFQFAIGLSCLCVLATFSPH